MSQYVRGAAANVNARDFMASTTATSSGPCVGRARTNMIPWPANCNRATTETKRSSSDAVIGGSGDRRSGERILVRAAAVHDGHRDAEQPQVDDELATMVIPVVQAHRAYERGARPDRDL